MTTVRELRKLLNRLNGDLEIVIYPKYSADKVDGYKKHRFRIDQVCDQEPYAVSIKDDKEALEKYFKSRAFETYEVNKHIAILF